MTSEQALLTLIEADRERQIAALQAEAQARAEAQATQAREAARKRVRETFAERRRLHAEQVAAASARCATQRRLHAQRVEAAWLRLAWQRLPLALQAAWQDPTQRAIWVQQAVASALPLLPRERWTVRHAADWPAAEQQALAATLQAQGLPVPLFERGDIPAGLAIVCGGNVVDATLGGLMADRPAIEARLLHLLESSAAAQGTT